MDLVVAHVKVEVPTRGPADLRELPLDVVSEDDLSGVGGHDRLRRQVRSDRHGEQVELGDIGGEGSLVLVLD